MPDNIRSTFARDPLPQPLDLRSALQALPLEQPIRSAWPVLAARLPPAAHPRWPWALAASVLLAVALVSTLGESPQRVVASATATATPTPIDPLPQLRSESAQLEALLAAAANGATTSAPVVVLSAELEDRLQGIDDRLDSAALTDAQRLPLWQQRVDVLRELAGLQSTQQWLAARGEQGYDGALVVAF